MTDTQTRPPEYLTVRELAELLRIKERKVYDLAASGEVPCSRATGKLLFPEREIRAWIAQASSGGPVAERADQPGVFLGSHDPLLEWALRQSRCGLATYFDGSLDGLTRFRAGEGVAAGLHIHDATTGEWNTPRVAADCAGENAVLVGWATRRRGLVIRAEEDTIAGISDLRGRRVVPRQPESGTETLFRERLAAAGLSSDDITLAEIARSEHDAVLAVAQGDADAAFGLEALARLFGLGFAPVVEERFDLLIDRRAWFEPPVQAFLAFCRTDEFRDRAANTAGYDVSSLGEVRWNA
ncbi:helix-turn-helix transcriptional regulator [Tranquillimonas alkanivorans]|uniref:DNA binding domain-containing protein, excisionase family n=1 Tax=Tranquillimonas alkanivorans TaxID=441119 RepID=A0A1I5N276_9RHOB|nr:helix-turn-helix transcriptional regulator [Tranquillimonas alkanivorans]SFP15371.1 DNA binding domain-containing protein, excisionase family [Tranquillimonas alkanivorans]